MFATDATNASRTMLFDITRLAWDDELCDLLHVPIERLPDVRRVERPDRRHVRPLRRRRPASRSAASPATSRRPCSARPASDAGMAKNTYGTGSFVLLNVGADCPPPTEGMLTTVAWTLADGTVAYALEGAIFSTGSAIQWLRDGLGVIADAAEIGPLAATRRRQRRRRSSSRRSPGSARRGGTRTPAGTIVGITRGTTRGPPRPGRRRVDGVPDP